MYMKQEFENAFKVLLEQPIQYLIDQFKEYLKDLQEDNAGKIKTFTNADFKNWLMEKDVYKGAEDTEKNNPAEGYISIHSANKTILDRLPPLLGRIGKSLNKTTEKQCFTPTQNRGEFSVNFADLGDNAEAIEELFKKANIKGRNIKRKTPIVITNTTQSKKQKIEKPETSGEKKTSEQKKDRLLQDIESLLDHVEKNGLRAGLKQNSIFPAVSTIEETDKNKDLLNIVEHRIPR